MPGEEYRPEPQKAIERQPQGIPPLDAWMLESIDQKREERGFSEGERLDPWYVSDSFTTYKDKIIAAEMRARGWQGLKGQPGTPIEIARRHSKALEETRQTETPEEKAFYASVQRIQNAYDIVAYPYYDVDTQQMLSGEVYGDTSEEATKSREPFTLSTREKETLQKIATAVDIPDNPQQRTYSFAALPQASQIVEAEEGGGE